MALSGVVAEALLVARAVLLAELYRKSTNHTAPAKTATQDTEVIPGRLQLQPGRLQHLWAPRSFYPGWVLLVLTDVTYVLNRGVVRGRILLQLFVGLH